MEELGNHGRPGTKDAQKSMSQKRRQGGMGAQSRDDTLESHAPEEDLNSIEHRERIPAEKQVEFSPDSQEPEQPTAGHGTPKSTQSQSPDNTSLGIFKSPSISHHITHFALPRAFECQDPTPQSQSPGEPIQQEEAEPEPASKNDDAQWTSQIVQPSLPAEEQENKEHTTGTPKDQIHQCIPLVSVARVVQETVMAVKGSLLAPPPVPVVDMSPVVAQQVTTNNMLEKLLLASPDKEL